MLGMDEELLKDAVILSTTGEAAEYQGASLGLYQKVGTINGSPMYKQMDSEEKGNLLFRGSNSFWYISWKTDFENFYSGSYKNTNSSATIPTMGWQYWNLDKVEKCGMIQFITL